jgi:HK97 gp10 family phage protein
MANDPSAALQRYFRDLPMKAKRELASVIKDEADGLAAAIQAAAPKKTGTLAGSVRVRRGRNTLELFVEAGGAATTKEVRAGSGQPYDYALGEEFGNSHAPAHPFFWNTFRARQADIRANIDAAVQRVLND